MKPEPSSLLRQRVILSARQYGISTTLFRNVVALKLGLNVTDMECLGLLFHKQFASPTELARHTGLTSGATTAMLDRLERAGLIARKSNPNDRRGTRIVLLEAGASRLGPWFRSIRRAQMRLVSNYTDDQLRTLDDYFQRSEQIWDAERRQLQANFQNEKGGRKASGQAR